MLLSMLGEIPGLRFEKFGKKDPRIGLYLLGHAGASREFRGVRLGDLHALDNLFGMHTLVYALGEDGKVELVHRPTDILSKRGSQAAFRLNLYGGHFSYVKHLSKYSRCFTCQRCDALFPKAHRLQRHERSCEENFLFGRLVVRCLGGIIRCQREVRRQQEKAVSSSERKQCFRRCFLAVNR